VIQSHPHIQQMLLEIAYISATQTMGHTPLPGCGPVPGRGGLVTSPWTDTQICILYNT